jgi:hypothetical protein
LSQGGDTKTDCTNRYADDDMTEEEDLRLNNMLRKIDVKKKGRRGSKK